MSGYLAALFSWIDPLCGPIGIFTLFGEGTQLACSGEGWGDEIASGFMVTAGLAVATLPIGLMLGFLIALAKQSDERSLRLASNIYTTLFRGLPELLTLFIIYYGLQIGLQRVLDLLGFGGQFEMNPFVAGMVALGVVFSAYCSEVLLSAFKAIPNGQYEAGDALGLRRSRTMLLVILPQLVRIALPGLGNLWMALLKDTALVSIIGLPDILRQTGIAARVTKEAFQFFGIACLLFLILSMLSSVAIVALERWSRRAEMSR
ncbi:ABC transporter permease [Ensifer soli]|uniref:ABC transporter permease n=1 Tax=Ciceribacter sp. sgz301302 TaxID=3342379 RepID=UPI0035BAD633